MVKVQVLRYLILTYRRKPEENDKIDRVTMKTAETDSHWDIL